MLEANEMKVIRKIVEKTNKNRQNKQPTNQSEFPAGEKKKKRMGTCNKNGC